MTTYTPTKLTPANLHSEFIRRIQAFWVGVDPTSRCTECGQGKRSHRSRHNADPQRRSVCP